MAAGAYLTWFGVHYWRSDTAWPSDPIKAVLRGQPVPTPEYAAEEAAMRGIQAVAAESAASAGLQAVANTANSGTPGAGGGASGSATANQVAAAALKYIGAGYVFGGPADRPGNWDCSSFVSYVLGHDLGLPLPGGKWGDPGFPPHAHGPATTTYMLYGQPVQPGQERKGDLIISSEHMGIVVADGTYMSAKTPSAGTGLGLYRQSFPGGTPVFRRVA